MMIGFPILMYYLWICLWFYDGKLVHPTSIDDIGPFLSRMWEHVRKVCFLLSLIFFVPSLYFHINYRMQVRMRTDGKSTPDFSSFNSLLPLSFQDTNKKASPSLL